MRNLKPILFLLVFLITITFSTKAQTLVGRELEGYQNSEYFDFNPSVSPDGNRLIFIRRIDGKKEIYLFYECIKEGVKWSEPKPLELINLAKGNYSFFTRASFDKLGTTIFFDGNLQGGEGEDDIYFSTLKDGYWQPPINAGPGVNSSSNDLSPWIDEDGNLFFNGGPVSLGKEGFQVMKSKPDGEGSWAYPTTWFPELGFYHTEHPVAFRRNAILIYAKNKNKDEHKNYLSIRSDSQWSVPIELNFDIDPSRTISTTYDFDIIYYDYQGDLYQAKVTENLKAMVNSATSKPDYNISPTPVAADRVIQQDNSGISSYENRIALVIGNADYAGSPLQNPVNDANMMAIELEKAGFEVIKYINADKKEMREAIRLFGDKLNHHEGVGLFYFAGHGLQSDGLNYLIPTDADIQREYDIEDQSIQADLVLRMMERYQNPMNIIILDACRNNPYTRSFRSLERGLAQPASAPTGSIVAFATAPGKTASDGDGDNGLYTQELIKAIRKPGLAIEEVLKEVRINVNELSNGEQTPWENSSLTGNFYFYRDQ